MMSDPESQAALRPVRSSADLGPADGRPAQSSVLMGRKKEQIKAAGKHQIGALRETPEKWILVTYK